MRVDETNIDIGGLRLENIHHAVVYDAGSPETLFSILDSEEFPSGLEVITGELSTCGWPKDISDIWTEKEKAESDVRKLKEFYWYNPNVYLPEMLGISREKRLKLGLGMVWGAGKNVYYNSYAFFDSGILEHVHHKRNLYRDESLVFTQYDRENDFIYDRGLILNCWEVYCLNPDFGAESRLQYLKEDSVTERIDRINVAAYWPNEGLPKYVSRAVRRKSSGERFGLKEEGLIAFVSNSARAAFVMAPSERLDEHHKSKTYAKLTQPGFLICRSQPDGSLLIETHVV